MPITEIKQPEEEAPETDELLLNEEIVDEDGGTKVIEPGPEAIDYPETLDDEADEPPTPLVKHLREELKRANREKAEMARKAAEPRIVRTAKPSLESCDWDEDKLADELIAWKANEAKADEQERAPAIPPERQQAAQEWQNELQTYKTNAAKLGKPDFDAAETAVITTLTDAQQSTIVMAAKDPARFIYALGKSPNRLAQLAEITNPIKLAAEVARIEGARIMARKEPANIDEPLRGGARLSVAAPDKKVDAIMKRLANGGEMTPADRAILREHRAKAA